MDCREEILFCNFVLPGNVQVIAVFSFRRQRLDNIYKNNMPTHEADLQDRFASEPVFVYIGRVISFLTHIPSLSEIVLQSPMYIQAEGGETAYVDQRRAQNILQLWTQTATCDAAHSSGGFFMEKGENQMKQTICTVLGLAGSAIAGAFGGWDTGLTTLVIFMSIDYISGIVVAGVFRSSPKTCNGALRSETGWKGLCRKIMTLLFVWAAYRVDLTIGTSYIRDAVIIAFIANELISIVENAGLMGIPLPEVITGAIDILQKKAKKE